MTAVRVLTIALEEWSARPVGHLVDEAGGKVEFDGWLSLATALEAICGSEVSALPTMRPHGAQPPPGRAAPPRG